MTTIMVGVQSSVVYWIRQMILRLGRFPKVVTHRVESQILQGPNHHA